MTDAPLIPGKYLAKIFSQLSQRGIALPELLQLTAMPLDADGEPQVPEKISAELYTRVYQYYLGTMHDEHFGLNSETGDAQGKYRILAQSIAQCRDLGSALVRAQEFYRAFGRGHESFEIKRDNSSVTLSLSAPLRLAPPLQTPAAANILISIRRMLEHLVGRRLDTLQVTLSGTEPATVDKYLTLFSAPVCFDQGDNALVLDTKVMEYPIVHTSTSIEQLLQQIPGILFYEPTPPHSSLRERIIVLLGHDLSRRPPGTNTMAKLLGLSPRAMRGLLRQEGSSYQDIKTCLRRERACSYLRQNKLSLAEIARKTGFPATSALHRAFKKWTGLTPGQYREQNRSYL